MRATRPRRQTLGCGQAIRGHVMLRLLEARLEHADAGRSKQQHLSVLRSALPVVTARLITQWQQQAAAYPHGLAVALVREYLRFRHGWEQDHLVERHNVLVLYD